MKTISSAASHTFAAALAAAFLFSSLSRFARGAEEELEQQFPHVIQFELGEGATNFYGGDQITITSVRGDREHIEAGGGYLVEGTYTLDTANRSQLALYCTTSGPGGPTAIQNGERMDITKGAGRFYLYETNLAEGWLHVCFTTLHGNVYFGEKGRENTIKRDYQWYKKATASTANRALIAYLGDPVPSPTDMDARYTKEGLSNAVQLAARNAGVTLKKLAIDDSEYPFLTGILCEGPDFSKLKAQINKMDGYNYGGGVGNDTCFVGCIVPHQVYPTKAWQQIYHRRTLREEVFYEKFCAQQ